MVALVGEARILQGVKRIAKGEWSRTIPAVLYSDDLVTLWGLFAETYDRVSMRLGGWEIDAVDEIEKIDVKQARDLSLIGSTTGQPSAVLTSNTGGFYMYLTDGTANTRVLGLKAAVERLLDTRQVGVAMRVSPTPLFVIGTIIAWLGPGRSSPWWALTLSVSIGFMIAGLVVIGMRAWALLRRTGTVYLRPSSAEEGGVKRSRDVMLILFRDISAAVVLLVVTLIAYYIFNVRLP